MGLSPFKNSLTTNERERANPFMFQLKLRALRFFYKLKYWRKDPPMVRYWMSRDSVEAKLIKMPEGHTVMIMEGEDYPFPGYPRGSLLYGPLSPLKHLIKNRVFNDSWKLLDESQDPSDNIRKGLDEAFALLEKGKYDLVPYDAMVPPLKELWRAMTVVEQKMGGRSMRLKELICFIMQEDDSYRMRLQWLVKFLGRKPSEKDFEYALSMLEHGENVPDMKERQRLLKRVIIAALKDPRIHECFSLLLKELDWKKLRLTKADKYFFRAKYFKVDYPEYDY